LNAGHKKEVPGLIPEVSTGKTKKSDFDDSE
jgi:hypothetical protein